MAFGGLFDMFGGGGGGSFSGGGIGSSQSAQDDNHKDFSKTDNRVYEAGSVVGGDLAIYAGDSPSTYNIMQTDQGAIRAGVDIAMAGIDSVQTQAHDSATALQSIASDSINQAYGLANQARQSETSGAINALTKYLFWVAIAGVAAWAIVKTSK